MSPKESDFPVVYEDFINTIKDLKRVKIMPDIELIGILESENFISMLAFTDTTEVLEDNAWYKSNFYTK